MTNELTPHQIAVKKAVTCYRNMAHMADAIGVSRNLIAEASSGSRRLGLATCLRIARATNGFVGVRELRPDVDWDASSL